MAIYSGIYYSDLGERINFFPLNFYLLQEKTNIINTDKAFDSTILPKNYFNLLNKNTNTCKNQKIKKPREFIINLSQDLKFICPILFLGGSQEFIDLFEEFTLIDPKLGYSGEILADWYLDLFLRKK